MVEGSTIRVYLNLQTRKLMLFHSYKILQNLGQTQKIREILYLRNLIPLSNMIITIYNLVIRKVVIFFPQVKFDSKLKVFD